MVLLGAGGAGAACADAVLRLGAGRLVIVDQDERRAASLAESLNRRFEGAPARATGDLPAAMAQASVVYVPLETPLLKAARAAGCATMDGGCMSVGQAVGAFGLFTGQPADAARMEAHFRSMTSRANAGRG